MNKKQCSVKKTSYFVLDLCGMLYTVLGVMDHLSMENLFNPWYKQGSNKYNSLLLTDVVAVCWFIWLPKNDSF
jgi:hypothetical protein